MSCRYIVSNDTHWDVIDTHTGEVITSCHDIPMRAIAIVVRNALEYAYNEGIERGMLEQKQRAYDSAHAEDMTDAYEQGVDITDHASVVRHGYPTVSPSSEYLERWRENHS